MQLLSFVAMRLDASPVVVTRPGGRRDEGTSIRSTISTVIGGSPSAPMELNPALARQLFEALATAAMQFRGYIHLVRDAQVPWPSCHVTPLGVVLSFLDSPWILQALCYLGFDGAFSRHLVHMQSTLHKVTAPMNH